MGVRILMLLWAVWITGSSVLAQNPTVQTYVLLSGSQLIDDCPICDRIPIVVPLAGNFGLELLDQSPLLTRYALTNIAFGAATTSGPPYQVIGSGVYQVGGEVAVSQELFLNAEISNSVASVNALCLSTNGAVSQPWPRIQIQADQTNGTITQVYHLTLVAVPAPEIRSITLDFGTGDVRLAWDDTGGAFQVQRAPELASTYFAVTKITTNSTFTDAGALTNSAQYFYRLRPF